MNTDTIAIILTVLLAVGGAYFKLSDRISRIEGIIEGWLNPLTKPTKMSEPEGD